jgi:phosphate transport system permease protein
MVVGLLALVLVQGFGTFWPSPVVAIETVDGKRYMGEVTRSETYRPDPAALDPYDDALRVAMRAAIEAAGGSAERRLLRIGNFELTNEHFQWLPSFAVARDEHPEWAVVIERRSWGRFYGEPAGFRTDGELVAEDAASAWSRFDEHHGRARDIFAEVKRLESRDLGHINARQEEARLALRRAELDGDPAEIAARRSDVEQVLARTEGEAKSVVERIGALNRESARHALVMRTADGTTAEIKLADIVRAYPANRLSWVDKLGIYGSRWGEFLTDEPRDANQEGGVFPAIFGTVVMTLLMSFMVVPLGVLAALYIREYAKAGLLISTVRVAVNNLAGVPSIVFGVFGLGFFCYFLGYHIDQLFFPEKLPTATFGTGGLLWASLTLALLTLPVVIVSTEEALAAVPSSMREGSYACGASKWQTIRRIVLPRAMPGIMTGMILAMARGAGEVAPLMLVGCVKLAPELPLDTTPPFLHGSRSFMHLGFHIYDQGFQSQNSEASKPMVYTTTLLLIGVIAVLNITAVWLRTRLRRRFVAAQF